MSDNVIKVEHVTKKYHLGTIGHGTLYRDMQSWWAKVRDKEDPNATISFSDICESRDSLLALDDVSFDVKRGDVVGIIGRNGAGKSTLLKIISRVTAPTNGEVKINGRVVSLLEVGTGFHPELTGRENIYLNGAIMGMRRKEIDRKFDEIVDFSEVTKFIDTPVKRYSSGMYVRLAFAVAAHLDPEILIVDEVLAVGDVQFQNKSLGKMQEVSKGGRTVLFVSHNMGTIGRLCNRGVLLENGKVKSDGEIDRVICDYLSSNTTSSKVYELPNDGKKEMCLRRMVLNPDVIDISNEVRYDSPIVFRVEYEVNCRVSNCTVWLALQTYNGTMIFTTADYDMDQSLLGRREPGYYVYDVYIPAKWLNVGKYNVVVGIVKNNPLIVYNREEALIFSVIEVGTPGSVLQAGVRRGVLQPFIEWKPVEGLLRS